MAIVPIPEKPILPVAPSSSDPLAQKFNADIVRLLYDILTKIARRANASVWIDPGDDQTAGKLVQFAGLANKVTASPLDPSVLSALTAQSTALLALAAEEPQLSTLAGSQTALSAIIATPTGLVTKTGTGAFTGRTLTGTANQIVVANGDGVAGDPAVSLPSVVVLKQSTIGSADPNIVFQDTSGAQLGSLGKTLGTGNPQIILTSNTDLWLDATGGSQVVTLLKGRLQFPLTANLSTNPNTLDDYEEGTWTPSYVPYSGPGFTSITYGIRQGIYTKIGNMIYVACRIYTSSISIGSASGPVTITGFPFGVPFYMSAVYVYGWVGLKPYGFQDVIRDINVSNMGNSSIDNLFYAFGQSAI